MSRERLESNHHGYIIPLWIPIWVIDLNRSLVLGITIVLALAVAIALPSAAAIKNGLTESLQENYFFQFLPIIVGLGVGAVYWGIISARRSR